MPANRRFYIAAAVSVGCHLIIILLVGFLAMRAPVLPEQLMPVELVLAEAPTDIVIHAVPARSQPEAEYAPTRIESSSAPTVSKTSKARPSNAGGTAARALAAPRILAVRKAGPAPAGASGNGTGKEGLGGKIEATEGPTYGPIAEGGGGPLPIYPKAALDQNLEGTVTLLVSVSSDGSITSIVLTKSSGHKALDEAAIRAVRKGWIFKPGMTKGTLAPGKSTITFEFSAGTVK